MLDRPSSKSVVKAIILDFDGVLVESNKVKTRAFEDLFSRYPEHSQAMLAYHLANQSAPRMHKFRYYVSNLMDLTKSTGDREAAKMGRLFSELVKERVIHCPEVKGAMQFLQDYSKRAPLFISSNTPDNELHEILESRGLIQFLKKAFGNPPITKGAAIAKVLKNEQLKPAEVVFIGDALSDYEAAVSQGLQFVGRRSSVETGGNKAFVFKDMHEISIHLDNLVRTNR